ncbi:hypothetical protein [Maribacter sp. 2-571]|uniref:hypothetical protein n=1 Tax=Maribacter sp. 2-571 TaxID=3417569 RepID=UPI003D328D07
MTLKKAVTVLILVLAYGCSEKQSEIIYLYPADRSQVVTIISNYTARGRAIAIGKHSEMPEKGYVLLDISGIREGGDEIGICWDKNGHRWEMVNNGSRVINNKLDTTQYVFRDEWFKDKRGIANPEYYWQPNCFTVGTLDFSKHKPKENGIVERK